MSACGQATTEQGWAGQDHRIQLQCTQIAYYWISILAINRRCQIYVCMMMLSCYEEAGDSLWNGYGLTAGLPSEHYYDCCHTGAELCRSIFCKHNNCDDVEGSIMFEKLDLGSRNNKLHYIILISNLRLSINILIHL